MRQTKIIATFGPSLEDPKILKKSFRKSRCNPLQSGTWDLGEIGQPEQCKKDKTSSKNSKEDQQANSYLSGFEGQ